MRIYKYSMRFRVPALDQSDCSICYNYDLIANSKYRDWYRVVSRGESTLPRARAILIYIAIADHSLASHAKLYIAARGYGIT